MRDGAEGRGWRLRWNVLWGNVRDRSMRAKGRPLLNLTSPLDRGQDLLETVHTAPNGLLLLQSRPSGSASALRAEGWPRPPVGGGGVGGEASAAELGGGWLVGKATLAVM